MNNDQLMISNKRNKYFYSLESKSMIPTVLFGFLLFFLWILYDKFHFDPFHPSFRWDNIVSQFFYLGFVPVFSFAIMLHNSVYKILKRFIILIICVVVWVIVLSTIIKADPLGVVYLSVYYFVSFWVACFAGFMARALINFSPLASKVFIVMLLFVFPLMMGYDFFIYSFNPLSITEARCKNLGANAQPKCFDTLARNTDNIVFCGLAEMKASQCYDDIATKLSKEGKLEVSVCLKMTDNPRISERECVSEIAEKLDDVSKCESLYDSKLRFECIGNNIKKFIKLEPKSRLAKCSSLSDRGDKTSCYFHLRDSFAEEKKNTGKLSQCDLLSREDKDLCYHSNTLGITPKVSCLIIVDSEIRRKCENYNKGGEPRSTEEAY